MARSLPLLVWVLILGSASAQNLGLSLSNPLPQGYFDVSSVTGLAPANITLEAWVTYDETTLATGVYVWPTIVRKNISAGGEEFFLRVNAGNTNNRILRWSVRTAAGMVHCDWSFGAGELLAPTHVAATWDGSISTIYINGSPVATATGNGALVDNGGALRVGNGDLATPETWNGIIDEVRIWSVARTEAEINAAMFQQIQIAPNLTASWILEGDVLDYSGGNHHGTLVGAGSFVSFTLPSPLYQTNQPESSIDIDGVQGTALTEAVASKCTATSGSVNLASTLAGTVFNAVVGYGNALPAGSGGFAFPDGQILNANLAGAFTLSGGPLGSVMAWPGNFSIPFLTPPAGIKLHAQSYHANAASAIGFSLGQASTLDSIASSTLTLTLGDDATQNVALGPPLCGPGLLPFYGALYSDFFVNSNGSVSFVGGETAFAAAAASFGTGNPRIAGFWTDLNPSLAGTVTVSSSPLGVTVSFVNVAQYAQAAIQSSFDILMEPTGQVTIMNYLPALSHTSSSLIGISPGPPATDPGPVSFSSLLGGPLQGGALTDMIYEYQPGGAVTGGWSGIVFPNGDSSAWFVY